MKNRGQIEKSWFTTGLGRPSARICNIGLVVLWVWELRRGVGGFRHRPSVFLRVCWRHASASEELETAFLTRKLEMGLSVFLSQTTGMLDSYFGGSRIEIRGCKPAKVAIL